MHKMGYEKERAPGAYLSRSSTVLEEDAANGQ